MCVCVCCRANPAIEQSANSLASPEFGVWEAASPPLSPSAASPPLSPSPPPSSKPTLYLGHDRNHGVHKGEEVARGSVHLPKRLLGTARNNKADFHAVPAPEPLQVHLQLNHRAVDVKVAVGNCDQRRRVPNGSRCLCGRRAGPVGVATRLRLVVRPGAAGAASATLR